ncbi:MAG TPA: SAM-dependent methyltransferase [Streptosporangiaceae bacterium]
MTTSADAPPASSVVSSTPAQPPRHPSTPVTRISPVSPARAGQAPAPQRAGGQVSAPPRGPSCVRLGGLPSSGAYYPGPVSSFSWADDHKCPDHTGDGRVNSQKRRSRDFADAIFRLKLRTGWGAVPNRKWGASVAGKDPSRPYGKYPPPGVDAKMANVARVYDAFLGGKDNFAADRQVVESVLRISPEAPAIARANRAFLRRVVRYLTGDAGVTQLLDIGSGLPTAGNVHEVAHEINPAVRTVYVDNDPVVHSHGQALLADRKTTEVVIADVRQPAEIVGHRGIRDFLDLSQPVGLLLIAVMHHVDDRDGPAAIMGALRDMLPAGSYLAISSFAAPGPENPEEQSVVQEMERILHDLLGTGYWRPANEVRGWFGDWTLVEPGLVPLSQWHPDEAGGVPSPLTHGLIGGVARKD